MALRPAPRHPGDQRRAIALVTYDRSLPLPGALDRLKSRLRASLCTRPSGQSASRWCEETCGIGALTGKGYNEITSRHAEGYILSAVMPLCITTDLRRQRLGWGHERRIRQANSMSALPPMAIKSPSSNLVSDVPKH